MLSRPNTISWSTVRTAKVYLINRLTGLLMDNSPSGFSHPISYMSTDLLIDEPQNIHMYLDLRLQEELPSGRSLIFQCFTHAGQQSNWMYALSVGQSTFDMLK